ncbi:hypothetical protein MELLADRAFT_90070 [Melampsora larici-populina 98AG31]|uniref:Uncharacterized protein n=1 Tax=Melampsora larici-populina (strain 98AG31 / pathotype 3-4-7) TaxID=747676 RepID=F4RVL2_MELLP|nr:hypothetical protein MELLADRAFT_90070 [Melampsora larici-populina 98AG31]
MFVERLDSERELVPPVTLVKPFSWGAKKELTPKVTLLTNTSSFGEQGVLVSTVALVPKVPLDGQTTFGGGNSLYKFIPGDEALPGGPEMSFECISVFISTLKLAIIDKFMTYFSNVEPCKVSKSFEKLTCSGVASFNRKYVEYHSTGTMRSRLLIGYLSLSGVNLLPDFSDICGISRFIVKKSKVCIVLFTYFSNTGTMGSRLLIGYPSLSDVNLLPDFSDICGISRNIAVSRRGPEGGPRRGTAPACDKSQSKFIKLDTMSGFPTNIQKHLVSPSTVTEYRLQLIPVPMLHPTIPTTGITAAAGTRLALQLILSPTLLFIVTTSPCQDWVICAPAAILRFEGRFSGPLSGIEPLFPVTRHHHGRPLSYHRKLIGQIFE